MFAKALLRNQRHFFGKGAILCVATAVTFPIISGKSKMTVCEKVPQHEVKAVVAANAPTHAMPPLIEPISETLHIESSNEEQIILETNVVVNDEEEDDAAWVEEKQKCSFCKMFILSPCKKPFKNWSNCVDKAKAEDKDFAEVCSEYTKALMECTSTHSEYFQALEQESAAEEEGTEEGQVETVAAEGEAVPASAEKQAYRGPSLDSEEDEK